MQQRLDYLDSLRGIAIIGVVLIHCGQIVPDLPEPIANFAAFGFRGVILFFIVSALTLFTVSSGRQLQIGSFYTRRFFRIAPMFYLAAIFYLWLNGAAPRVDAPQGIHTTDIVLTFAFLHALTPTSVNGVVPGGWSIGSEALFYAMFPFLLAWITTIRRAAVGLVLSLAFSAGAGFALSKLLKGYYPTPTIDLFLHFGFHRNLPAFMSGIFVYHLIRHPLMPKLSYKTGSIIFWLGLAALTVVGLSGNEKLSGTLVVLMLLSTLCLGAIYGLPSIISGAWLRHIGVVSFSIYLVHFAIVAAIHPLVEMTNFSPSLKFILVFFMVFIISIFISTLTYKYIESPMIAIGARLSKRLRPEGAA